MATETRWKQLRTALKSAATSVVDALNPAAGEVDLSAVAVVAAAELGEQVHVAFGERSLVETAGWAGEQTRRVGTRLNRVRVPRAKLEPVVVATDAATAFTFPGRYVYISRELLQRLPQDAAVAFVLAREMAHHDLGHLERVAAALARLPGPLQVTAVALAAQQMLCQMEMELAADDAALRLCERADYAPSDCLDAFQALEELQVDLGRSLAVGSNDGLLARLLETAPGAPVDPMCARVSVAERKARLQEAGGRSH